MTPAVPLHKYQVDYMLDVERFKLAMFARQTGKTFTTTLEIVDDCFAAETQATRAKWAILSAGERQAREAMEEGVKRHCAAYGLAFEALESTWDVGAVSYRALEVKLPQGSSVLALPANPDTARGFSRNMFLDEFARHHNSREIWKAAFPIVSAGFKMRVASTPNGKGNKFYELASSDDPIWSKHVVDIHRAVREGLPRDIDTLRRALADEDAWAQEYELQWLDEASAWLSYELISTCEAEGAGEPDLYAGGVCYLGNDIGRRRDLWVAIVLERVGDVLWLREISTLHRASFAAQDAEFERLMRKYRVSRACMDQTGMGEKPVEDMRRRYGSLVEGVLFTSPNKLTLATRGKEAFEDRAIRIPEGDVRLRADLHSLKKLAGPTGAPRFVVEDEGGESGGSHADRAWALFLALNAAADPTVIDFQRAGRKRALPGLGDYFGGMRRRGATPWQ